MTKSRFWENADRAENFEEALATLNSYDEGSSHWMIAFKRAVQLMYRRVHAVLLAAKISGLSHVRPKSSQFFSFSPPDLTFYRYPDQQHVLKELLIQELLSAMRVGDGKRCKVLLYGILSHGLLDRVPLEALGYFWHKDEESFAHPLLQVHEYHLPLFLAARLDFFPSWDKLSAAELEAIDQDNKNELLSVFLKSRHYSEVWRKATLLILSKSRFGEAIEFIERWILDRDIKASERPIRNLFSFGEYVKKQEPLYEDYGLVRFFAESPFFELLLSLAKTQNDCDTLANFTRPDELLRRRINEHRREIALAGKGR